MKTVDPEVVDEKAVVPSGGNSLIEYAIYQNAPIETLKELMALQERDDANKARKAYHKAMARFKANPPTIEKTAEVDYRNKVGVRTHYFHADIAVAAEIIATSLGKHGLSHGWKTTQEGNNITVTCTITHELGHSESTSLSAGPDMSGGKDAIQGLSSTVTRLERYTLLAITGIAAKGQDKEDPPDIGEPTPHEQWLIKLDEVIDGGRWEDVKDFWPTNKTQIGKDCSKPEAAKIYAKANAAQKKMKAESEAE